LSITIENQNKNRLYRILH